MLSISKRLLGLGFIILAGALAVSAQTRTRTVATTGESAPGGGIFAPTVERAIEKGLPTISGETIVFGSDVILNGQSVYGIFTESGGVLRAVTRVGAPAPGGGTIQDIGHYTCDRLGNVFLTVRTGGGPGMDAVLKYSFGVLSLVARTGAKIPGDRVITSVGLAVAADGFGGVYFQCSFGTTPDSGSTALVRWKSAVAEDLVAATGDASVTGGTWGAISQSTLASSTSGLVVFASTVNGGTSGLFTGLAGNLSLADPTVTANPNITIADNDDGEISFMAPGVAGIRMVTLTGTTTFVTNGMPAPRTPGTINFGGFNVGMGADREGSLFFLAPISNGDGHGAGLFSRDRFTGAVTALVLQGDPAPGDVSGVFGLFAIAANLPTHIVNDDGKIVFVASAGVDATNVAFFTTLNAPEGLVPSIASASVKNTKLTVVGGSFEPGARIQVNGVTLTDTKNNKKAPTTKLVSKTGGGSISPGETVSITVVNATGSVSAPFSYTRPR
ncbi:MAG TPA: hypothetical protein PLF26_04295 [Blastocatellia bacterium]|nr:hypothetical protein [Blastocatellia bacterium]